MAVRHFDLVDDSLDFPMASFSAPVTFAVLVEKVNDANYQTIFYGCQSGGVGKWGILFDNANHPCFGDNNNSSNVTQTLTSADGWAILVGSHPGGNGTDAGRLHLYKLGAGTWTHGDGNDAADLDISPSTGVGGTLRIGNNDIGLPAGVRIATAAVWSVELTDLEVETLSTNLATQDWADLQSANLELLADFNQASVSTAVVDLSGNGRDQSAITGTDVVTGSDPSGWTFGVSSGQSVAIGQVTETDTANALTPSKALGITQVSETDTANAITPSKSLAVSQAAETETANPITPSKSLVVGQVTETNTANAITVSQAAGSQSVAIGQTTETDTANTVTPSKSLALSQATETETAQGITPSKTLAIGQASETELAQPITPQRFISVGQIVVSETAQPITPSKTLAIAQVIETDTARHIALLQGGAVATTPTRSLLGVGT